MATVATTSVSTAAQRMSWASTIHCSPLASEFSIVAADLLALSAPAILLSVFVGVKSGVHEIAMPLIAILVVLGFFRLYPGVGLDPVTEFRRVCVGTAASFLGVLFATYRQPHSFREIATIFIWGAGMMGIPMLRGLARGICASRRWWGYPVFVVGTSDMAKAVITRLQKDRRRGLKPVAIFDDIMDAGMDLCGVPVLGQLDVMDSEARLHSVNQVIVAAPGGALQQRIKDHIELKAPSLSRILFVSDTSSPSSLEVRTRDISRILAIEVPRTLLLPGSRITKRALDIVLTSCASVVAAPIAAIICLLVKLNSPGPIFYSHLRIGRGGRMFKVWKFRSMAVDGDAILKKHLAAHPEMAEEWERTQKLKNDPRVTKLGLFLRRTSLDELPQLWNILRGDMSLVGPRPVVEAETSRYGDMFSHYMQVAPGLTGLWQVSGRNKTSYEERVELDTYYVRNWSPWFDLYLLARTVVVVLRRDGAY